MVVGGKDGKEKGFEASTSTLLREAQFKGRCGTNSPGYALSLRCGAGAESCLLKTRFTLSMEVSMACSDD